MTTKTGMRYSLRQEQQRVGRGSIDADFVMDVRPCAAAGTAGQGDDRASPDFLSYCD